MGDPLRVMIVEDNAILAMELEAILEEAGHQTVGWAPSFREAKQLIEHTDPDLAFVDIQLADGPTGVDVARALKRKGNTLVVFMTASAEQIPDDFAGAAGLIAKPYTHGGLIAALEYLHQWVRSSAPRLVPPVCLELAPAPVGQWND